MEIHTYVCGLYYIRSAFKNCMFKDFRRLQTSVWLSWTLLMIHIVELQKSWDPICFCWIWKQNAQPKKKCKRKKTIKKFLLQQIVIIVMCVAFTSVHSTSTNVMKLSLHFICDTIPVSIYMIEWILWMLSGPQHWRQSAKVRYLSVLLTYKRKRYTYIKYRRQASE